MSEKFDMKLVIDAVTTPLLHARLRQASSYRERAALLRSLAEAALRENCVTLDFERQVAVRAVYPAAVIARNVIAPEAVDQRAAATRVATEAVIEEDELRSINGTDEPGGHDVDQIADAFGAFF
ncbi:hypothetical protein AB3X96_37300 [Paraburkholderia sp. BR13439]|uniref:hypothetical protein n=1 Tax=unclassified Paraburkholderia TaxID=2615204 RepID=UPI0034CD48A5